MLSPILPRTSGSIWLKSKIIIVVWQEVFDLGQENEFGQGFAIPTMTQHYLGFVRKVLSITFVQIELSIYQPSTYFIQEVIWSSKHIIAHISFSRKSPRDDFALTVTFLGIVYLKYPMETQQNSNPWRNSFNFYITLCYLNPMLFHSPYKTLNCHPDYQVLHKTFVFALKLPNLSTAQYISRIPLADIDKDKDKVN